MHVSVLHRHDIRLVSGVKVHKVQQRLTTGEHLVAATQQVPGRNRRALVRRLALDIADGAQSLGELVFAAACRRRGLPEPTRQVVRRLSSGRVYLDVCFEEHGLVVEIDGAGHGWGLAKVVDALRSPWAQATLVARRSGSAG